MEGYIEQVVCQHTPCARDREMCSVQNVVWVVFCHLPASPLGVNYKHLLRAGSVHVVRTLVFCLCLHRSQNTHARMCIIALS